VSWCIANGASNEGRPAQMELLDTRRRDVGRAAHPDQVALIAGRMLSGAGSMEPRVRDRPPARQLAAWARHDMAARLGSTGCPTLVTAAASTVSPHRPTASSWPTRSRARGWRCSTPDLFLLRDRAAMPAVIEFLGAGAPGSAGP
jgi:hypothetical protein